MKKFVAPEDMFGNWDDLTSEERLKLEETQYRKQIITSHGFTPEEYEMITKLKNRELMP